MSAARQADAATLSLLVLAWLGALSPALPWFRDWPESLWLDFTMVEYLHHPDSGFGTWIGVLVGALDAAIVVAMALELVRWAWAPAALALLALGVVATEQVFLSRPGMGSRLDWSRLRWGFAAPIAANALLLVLGWRLRALPAAAAV